MDDSQAPARRARRSKPVEPDGAGPSATSEGAGQGGSGRAVSARAAKAAKAAKVRPTLMLLVRHGLTPTTGKHLPGRAPGLDLAEAGVGQAERAAEAISAATSVDAIYASPLERARQTAAPIAKATGVRVRTDKGLLEVDTGDWTGMSLAAARKLPEWKVVQGWPGGFRFPGGESLVEMAARMTTTMERLRAAHPGEVVVAVSHADPIKAAVMSALGCHMDLFQRLTVSPASVSIIAYGPTGPMVLGVNLVGQLPPLRAA
ncbi:MAG: histidine phosphatase family protein [Acidimicrobiales bacterium]